MTREDKREWAALAASIKGWKVLESELLTYLPIDEDDLAEDLTGRDTRGVIQHHAEQAGWLIGTNAHHKVGKPPTFTATYWDRMALMHQTAQTTDDPVHAIILAAHKRGSWT